MNEHDWLACEKRPDMMLAKLRGKASDRKHRLFACGSARRYWQLFTEQTRRAVEVSELFADGHATLDELDVVHRDVAHGQSEREAWLAFQATLREGASAAFAVTGPGFYKAARKSHQWSDPWFTWRKLMCALLRDIYANPYHPVTLERSWQTTTVVSLAQAIYDQRHFQDMPILADALEDAGCTNEEILAHARGAGPHVRGCWLVDLILGKE